MNFSVKVKKLIGPVYRNIQRTVLGKIYSSKIFTFKRYDNLKLNIDLKKDVDFRIFINKFEDNVLNNFKAQLHNSSVFIDVGANIGLYSLLAAQIIKKEKSIFAFEPAPLAYQKFLSNITLNNFNQITAVNSCVSDYIGEIELNICEDDAYNSIGNNPMLKIKDTIKTPVITIDEFVKVNKLKSVDVIKIDTEGAEFLVCKGAINTILQFKPMFFFEVNQSVLNGFNHSGGDIFNFFKEMDYMIYNIDTNSTLNPLSTELYGIDSDSIVAVHKNQSANNNFTM